MSEVIAALQSYRQHLASRGKILEARTVKHCIGLIKKFHR